MQKEWQVGDVVAEDLYTACAVFCNKNGTMHIELQEGRYVVVGNTAPAAPTTTERVRALESQTGLTRAVRELVLSENSGVSEYVKGKALEIEELAVTIRSVDTSVE